MCKRTSSESATTNFGGDSNTRDFLQLHLIEQSVHARTICFEVRKRPRDRACCAPSISLKALVSFMPCDTPLPTTPGMLVPPISLVVLLFSTSIPQFSPFLVMSQFDCNPCILSIDTALAFSCLTYILYLTLPTPLSVLCCVPLGFIFLWRIGELHPEGAALRRLPGAPALLSFSGLRLQGHPRGMYSTCCCCRRRSRLT